MKGMDSGLGAAQSQCLKIVGASEYGATLSNLEQLLCFK